VHDGTRPPPGGLEAGRAWRLVSSARRYGCSRNCFAHFDVHDLQCFSNTLKVDLLVFLELWLRTYPLSCGSG